MNFAFWSPRLGSSPLARGTLGLWLRSFSCLGLIPARAGNTQSGQPNGHRVWAHPRSRGEHVAFGAQATSKTGSSPLARGTPGLLRPRQGRLGLIPARAGNTERQEPEAESQGAHPRSRGEHLRKLLTKQT